MTTGEFAWLPKVLGPIGSAITPLAKKHLEQNQLVIELQKRMGFSPDHPPADFRGVYAYAIAGYTAQRLEILGELKLKQFLTLLALPEIAAGMRSAWDQGDLAMLLKAGDQACEQLVIGDDLSAAQIDWQAELTALYGEFQQVVEKTQLPRACDQLMD